MSKHRARVRVDYDDLTAAALRQPREKIGITLARLFKRRCVEYKILPMCKDKEFFVGKSEKLRKRRLKSKLALLKTQQEEQQQAQSGNNIMKYPMDWETQQQDGWRN